MSRVCIIGCSNLFLLPFRHYYENALRELGIDYDFYYWNRHGVEESRPNNYVAFDRPGAGGSLPRNAIDHALYGRFLVRELSKKDYSLHVVLSPEVGILLRRYLRGKRYILDIRDYSLEHLWLYRKCEQRLIESSLLTPISSEGFLRWLPAKEARYLYSPNASLELLDEPPKPFDFSSRVLSYIGWMGYYVDANIDFLASSQIAREFSVRYIGTDCADEKLMRFCKAGSFDDVQFLGHFPPEEKQVHYANTNFVLGVFGNASQQTRTLLPNRLYECAAYRRPIIVSAGTYLAEVVSTYGLGVVYDPEQASDLPRQLSWYYEADNFAEFSGNCERFIGDVRRQIVDCGGAIKRMME